MLSLVCTKLALIVLNVIAGKKLLYLGFKVRGSNNAVFRGVEQTHCECDLGCSVPTVKVYDFVQMQKLLPVHFCIPIVNLNPNSPQNTVFNMRFTLPQAVDMIFERQIRYSKIFELVRIQLE